MAGGQHSRRATIVNQNPLRISLHFTCNTSTVLRRSNVICRMSVYEITTYHVTYHMISCETPQAAWRRSQEVERQHVKMFVAAFLESLDRDDDKAPQQNNEHWQSLRITVTQFQLAAFERIGSALKLASCRQKLFAAVLSCLDGSVTYLLTRR